jgi:UDP-glucose 4-epimerase
MAPRRSGDPARLVAAADKAHAELGWSPQFTQLKDIVSGAWQWHQRHPNGYDA